MKEEKMKETFEKTQLTQQETESKKIRKPINWKSRIIVVCALLIVVIVLYQSAKVIANNSNHHFTITEGDVALTELNVKPIEISYRKHTYFDNYEDLEAKTGIHLLNNSMMGDLDKRSINYSSMDGYVITDTSYYILINNEVVGLEDVIGANDSKAGYNVLLKEKEDAQYAGLFGLTVYGLYEATNVDLISDQFCFGTENVRKYTSEVNGLNVTFYEHNYKQGNTKSIIELYNRNYAIFTYNNLIYILNGEVSTHDTAPLMEKIIDSFEITK